MKRYQTIFVAAALDDRDPTVLQHAAHFARAADSQALVVAHVAPAFNQPPEVAAYTPEIPIPTTAEMRQRLEATVATLRDQFPPDLGVECLACHGSLISDYVRLASQKNADLLCLGRRSRAEHDRLSEAAVTVLRKSPCSTFLIPAGCEAKYERILVPVDFSDDSREALDVAAAVAATCPGASIVVLHVYSVPLGYYKLGRTHDEFARQMKTLAEQEWDKFSRSVNFRGVPGSVRFELSDNVPLTILAIADELDSRLIVISSHGRTRAAGVLLGHAADTVSAKATRPLLCVKKKGEVVSLLRALLQLFELA